MPRKYPAPDFELSELVDFARSQGYSANEASDLAEVFRVDAPEWSVTYYTYSKDDLDDYDYSEQEKKLMLDFLAHHKTDAICILK